MGTCSDVASIFAALRSESEGRLKLGSSQSGLSALNTYDLSWITADRFLPLSVARKDGFTKWHRVAVGARPQLGCDPAPLRAPTWTLVTQEPSPRPQLGSLM